MRQLDTLKTRLLQYTERNVPALLVPAGALILHEGDCLVVRNLPAGLDPATVQEALTLTLRMHFHSVLPAHMTHQEEAPPYEVVLATARLNAYTALLAEDLPALWLRATFRQDNPATLTCTLEAAASARIIRKRWNALCLEQAENGPLRALRKRLEPNVTTLTGWLLSPANNLASAT